ncbi:hypothetical protein SAMN04487830_103121 [Pseudobutyrivibrio sp. OR37]|uniref:hypothetical protein n=1 Tax=Pseudobutyrivibrio sp. OR37 TaxID=1798186 RepID=UPI0008E3F191|nr:hypothetical protein [Pseudobutyrivibrio sp. OR37]SFH62726.1 hypothetical protein SAMN04487830_103121 [Pseudobutyrivibrio sp. OR37]
MKTKPIPIIIALAAASISCVISIMQHVEFSVFVSRLLVVVVIFLVMGTIIKMILDYSFRTIEPTVAMDEQIDAMIPDEEGTEGASDEDVATAEENSSDSEEG